MSTGTITWRSTLNISGGDAPTCGLKDNVAVVTGGATGTGEAIACRLRRVGATAAIVDLGLARAENVAADIGNIFFAVSADVFDDPSVRLTVGSTLARTGRIDILNQQRGNRRNWWSGIGTEDDKKAATRLGAVTQ